MDKEFSFNYGEKQRIFPVLESAVYELEKGVTVEVICKNYPQFNASYWTLFFENKSEKNSKIISDIWDCDTLLSLPMPLKTNPGYKPAKGDACVITMNGMVDGKYYWENDKISSSEYNFNYEYLNKTPIKRFSNINGCSSEEMMPFFDITANGEGYIASVGWTGDWKTEFSKLSDGIRMKSGLKETKFYLKPGEKIRTSSTLIMHYSNADDKFNKFRKLIKNHFSHTRENTRNGLMAVEFWGGLKSEEMIKRINEFKARGIEFEDVWIDAAWYGKSTECDYSYSGDWGMHTGDWTVNKRVHPNDLTDVCDVAKKSGMNLMLWFEPERAVEGTPITKERPDWFLRVPGRNNLILNYGNKDAVDYIYKVLSHYIIELDLSCYRQDFNIELTSYFQANDEENRRGITEIKHVTGMYALWDKLLEKYPNVIIDNCASGGRRIDIETLQRSIPFFRSDYLILFNEEPEVLQVHNANISCYLPYNGCTIKTKNDTYTIRSSYSSSWGAAFYNVISSSMSEEDFKWTKKITDEYRKIRKYFSMDFYNHGSSAFDDTSWAIWQYHDAKTQSGIVMAFRRCNSPFSQVSIKLKGLDENKVYVYQNLDSNFLTEGTQTLTVDLPQKRSSAIFEYKLK